MVWRVRRFGHGAERNSAIRQIENLRYAGGPFGSVAPLSIGEAFAGIKIARIHWRTAFFSPHLGCAR